MDDTQNQVILLNEDEKEVRFEHLATLEYNDKEYVVLLPLDEIEDIEHDEVIILRAEKDDKDEDIYVGLDDDKEIEDVFNVFEQIYYGQ